MSRTIVLTGATGGIGAAVARLLAYRGDRLLLTSRSRVKLDSLVSELEARGGHLHTVVADIATAEGRAALVAAARELGGGIDVLINNAGASWSGTFANQPQESQSAMLATNLLAPMLLVQDFLSLLEQRPHAVIANVGSVVGSIALPGQATYAATKFGLRGFSEALRRELSGSGIRVVYFAPRATDTPMNDAFQRDINDRLRVTTDDPAAVARRLVSAIDAGRRERFVGWPERFFVKLNAILPGLVDAAMKKQARLIRESTVPATLELTPNGAEL